MKKDPEASNEEAVKELMREYKHPKVTIRKGIVSLKHGIGIEKKRLVHLSEYDTLLKVSKCIFHYSEKEWCSKEMIVLLASHLMDNLVQIQKRRDI